MSVSRLHMPGKWRVSEMAPILRVRASVVLMTPDEARRIIESELWDRQRMLREGHVEYLTDAARRGELWKLDIEFAELPDGTRYLVNGQHRLHVIVATGVAMPCVVTVTLVADLDGVADLYSSLDRQRTRTMDDALRAHALTTKEEISVRSLAKLSAGVALIVNDFSREYSGRTKSLNARTADVEAWLPEIETYLSWLRSSVSEMWQLMTRSAVSSVALVTIRYSAELAEEFWLEIMRDDGLRVGDPRHTLLRWLRATPLRQFNHPVDYAMYVALAWNHYAAGTNVERMIVKNRTAPIRIIGSPFDGREREE